METFALKSALDAVREENPLVHCITNYVTVNDCANALLACGASPIMSDEPADVEDITSICNALVLNIGTLNQRTIAGMHRAATRASALGHPVVFDPVGAGASTLRTKVATDLLREHSISVVRGNMSEVKALYASYVEAGSSTHTRGVDVASADIVDAHNMSAAVQFACTFAQVANVIVAITGPVDLVASATECYAVHNGSALCARITGAGCMLTCTMAAYIATSNSSASTLQRTLASVAAHGICGEIADARMKTQRANNPDFADGNGSYRTYFLDALFNLSGDALEQRANIERVK